MDITSFIHTQRQEGLLLGDYNAYRAQCSRRLATLRKRLHRSTPKGKKYNSPAPLTPEDLSKDHSHAYLLLLSAERAWAHGLHLKSIVTDDPASASSDVRNLLISRLHKASTHARELCTLLSSPESSSTSQSLLEATAYSATLAGTESLEKSRWELALKHFSVAKIIYTVLTGEMYKDQLTTTVDPSIRYGAYQLQLPRSLDMATIARKHFPRDEYENVAKLIEELDPNAFSDPAEKSSTAAAAITEISWRGRCAPVEDADISVALADAQAAEAAFDAREDKKSIDSFDGVLAAWQETADAVRKTIDERTAEGMGMGEPKMQALQLTYTAVNYTLICWRVGRNRVMIENIASTKAPGSEVKGKKLAHLKEEVVLYDAILQSLDQISSLPGIAADTTLTQTLTAKRSFFLSLRCRSIAHSHILMSSLTNALALFARALSHITPALPVLSSPDASSDLDATSHRGLAISAESASNLQESLNGLVTRYRALVHLDSMMAKTQAAGYVGAGKAPLVERLDEWPEQGIDWENGVVQWPPKLLPVPVKPLFLDIAWNYVEYPGVVREVRGVESVEEREEKAEKARKGLLGRLWGR